MEYLFYTSRKMTPKHARELYRHSFMQYHVMYALLFICYIALFVFVRNTFPSNVITFILLISIVIMYLYRPYSYAKKRIKEYTVLHNAIEEDEAFFYEDYFVSRDINTKQEIKIEYKNLTKMKSTKTLYIFHIKNSKTRIITEKNMIAKSDITDFEQFIKSKIS